jgi:hypothetical protein
MKRHLGFVMLTAFGGVGCSQAQALQDGVAFVADTAEEQGISVPGGEDSNGEGPRGPGGRRGPPRGGEQGGWGPPGGGGPDAPPPDPLALPECGGVPSDMGAGARMGPRQRPPLPPGACEPPARPEGEGRPEGAPGERPDGPPPDGMGPPPGMGDGGAGAGPRRGPPNIHDLNEDGLLHPEERLLLAQDVVARCEAHQARVLERFDTDQDGALSDAEHQAGVQTVTSEREARVASLVASNDADGNGCLSPDEGRTIMEARHQALVTQFDANGDGSLDAVEKALLREELRNRFRAGLMPGEEN